MRVVLAWWGVCFAFFYFGWPIQYNRTNVTLTVLLVTACAGVAVLGFNLGRGVRSASAAIEGGPPRAMVIGLGLSVLLFFPTVQAYSGLGVGDLGAAVQDQSAAYQETTELIEAGSASRKGLLLANTLAAPLTVGVIPYFVLRAFERRAARDRILAIVSVLPSIAMSLLTGRTQAMGIVVVVAIASLLVALERTGARFSWQRWTQIGLLSAGLFALVAWRNQARVGASAGCRPGQVACTESHAGAFDGFISVTSYASQGFEGLGRAMEGTWHFGGGFGHSPALRNFVGTFTGVREDVPTITGQLYQQGWDETGFWSTGWSQLANDVPWLLLPLVFGALAILAGAAYSSAVATGAWIPLTLFSYLFLAFSFMPQNYQLGANGPTYVGVLVLAFIFVLSGGLTRKPDGDVKPALR